jgi:hypothetical protein
MDDNSNDSPLVDEFRLKGEWQIWKEWQINKDKVEWREKQLAQEAYSRRQLFEELPMHIHLNLPIPNFDIPIRPDINFIGAEGSRGPVFTHFKDETRRRKRQHTSNSDPMTYISELWIQLLQLSLSSK